MHFGQLVCPCFGPIGEWPTLIVSILFCYSVVRFLLIYEVINMPPSFINAFSSDGTSLTSFGSEMGMVVVPQSDQSIAASSSTPGPNITIDAGRKLTRGSWNAQPYVDSFPLAFLLLIYVYPDGESYPQNKPKGSRMEPISISIRVGFLILVRTTGAKPSRPPFRNVGSFYTFTDIPSR